MGRMGSFDMEELRAFRDRINQLSDTESFLESCTKDLAARLFASVKRRTPSVTGNLRRGWTVGEIRHEGNDYIIDITNPVEYATYVEYGHRTRNHRGWVTGKFMMTISEQELQRIAPRVLENKIRDFLGGVFNG